MRRRTLFALGMVSLVVGLVVVAAGVVWLTEPYISYGTNSDYEYRLIGNRWVTFNWIEENQSDGTLINILCYNRGSFTGKYDLLVTFVNATFATTVEPFERVNSTTARISYELGSHEARSSDIYFAINEGVKGFAYSLWFDPKQLFIASVPGNIHNVNTFYFVLDAGSGAFVPNMVMRTSGEVAFRREFGDVNVSSPVLGFSPPVPLYRALKLALEEGGWNQGSLRNMTVKVSLDYYEFTDNVTFAEGNHTLLSNGSYRIGEVTQPVDSYAPVIIQSATNGTIAYRYIWDIGIVHSNGLLSIPPPGLYWVDAATAEMVPTGILI